jgi:hypothetical protein
MMHRSEIGPQMVDPWYIWQETYDGEPEKITASYVRSRWNEITLLCPLVEKLEIFDLSTKDVDRIGTIVMFSIAQGFDIVWEYVDYNHFTQFNI